MSHTTPFAVARLTGSHMLYLDLEFFFALFAFHVQSRASCCIIVQDRILATIRASIPFPHDRRLNDLFHYQNIPPISSSDGTGCGSAIFLCILNIRFRSSTSLIRDASVFRYMTRCLNSVSDERPSNSIRNFHQCMCAFVKSIR